MKELGLTKPIVQLRANQIVRELHIIEESEEALRLLQERRAAKKHQGYDKSLAECHTKTSSTKKANGKSGGIQTGLRAFFVATKSNSKKSKVVIMDQADRKEKSPESTGKRKDPADEDTPTGKKAKKESQNDDGSASSSGSVEKTIRAVVNENDVIEIVSVPKAAVAQRGSS